MTASREGGEVKVSTGRVAAWWTMFVLSLLVVLLVSRYLTLDPDVYFPEQRGVYVDREAVLVTHVAAAMLALLIGPLQLARRIRTRSKGLHRVLGRIYGIAAVVGGTAGIALATTAYGGMVSTVGFALLGAGWVVTTVLGVQAARTRRMADHRRWIIRSFALCFAAVTLRLYLVVVAAVGIDFETAYQVVAWACWVPNIALVLALQRRGVWT